MATRAHLRGASRNEGVAVPVASLVGPIAVSTRPKASSPGSFRTRGRWPGSRPVSPASAFTGHRPMRFMTALGLVVLAAASASGEGPGIRIRVTNPLDAARPTEVVEVEAAALAGQAAP